MKMFVLLVTLAMAGVTGGCAGPEKIGIDRGQSLVILEDGMPPVVYQNGHIQGYHDHVYEPQQVVVQPPPSPVIVTQYVTVPTQVAPVPTKPQVEVKINVVCKHCGKYHPSQVVVVCPTCKLRHEGKCTPQKKYYPRSQNLPLPQSAIPADPVRFQEETFRLGFSGMANIDYSHRQGTRNYVYHNSTPWGETREVKQEPYSETRFRASPARNYWIPPMTYGNAVYGHGGYSGGGNDFSDNSNQWMGPTSGSYYHH